MTVEEAIQTALFRRVRSLPIFTPDHRAWPNIKFDPPADAYLQIVHFPNGTQRLFVKGSDPHLYLGILQLTVVSPLNVGPSPATLLAGQVAEHFPADQALYVGALKVRITQSPDVGAARATDVSWDIPVSVRYEALARSGTVAGEDTDPGDDIDGDFTGQPGVVYRADTSGGSFTFSLPADPAIGAEVTVYDPNGSWATNPLIIDPNGETLDGVAGTSNANIPARLVFVYLASGWQTLEATPLFPFEA